MPVKMSKTVICKGTLLLLFFASAIWVLHSTARPALAGPSDQDRKEEVKSEMQTPFEIRRERIRRKMQNRAGGLPPEILVQQIESRKARIRSEMRNRATRRCKSPQSMMLSRLRLRQQRRRLCR